LLPGPYHPNVSKATDIALLRMWKGQLKIPFLKIPSTTINCKSRQGPCPEAGGWKRVPLGVY
jgi:hypothetical protein